MTKKVFKCLRKYEIHCSYTSWIFYGICTVIINCLDRISFFSVDLVFFYNAKQAENIICLVEQCNWVLLAENSVMD
jgi:hypothetical protein